MFQSPAVANGGVAPVPDEMRGDEVMAIAILNEGYEPTEQTARDIFDFCMERLTYFKVPGYIAFKESLPMTATEIVTKCF